MRVFACFMLLCAGCAGPDLVPATAGAPALRVLSWNVNYGVEGHPDALALIARLDADVVLLQETTPGWEDALRATFAPHYPHMRFHHCCGAGGLAVLSHHPIARDEVVPAVSWFPAWRGVVQTPLGPVQLLSVHLRPPFSDDGSVASGLYETPPIRAREMAAFAATLEDDVPTIVAGDFNEGSGDAVAQRDLDSDRPRRRRGAEQCRQDAGDAGEPLRPGVPRRHRPTHDGAFLFPARGAQEAGLEQGGCDPDQATTWTSARY